MPDHSVIEDIVSFRRGKTSLEMIKKWYEKMLLPDLQIEGEGDDRISLEATLPMDPKTHLIPPLLKTKWLRALVPALMHKGVW